MLVGLLRRIEMRLDVIATVLHAVDSARADLVRSHWDRAEKASAERRALVDYICSRLEGATMNTHTIELRTLPERRITSISRHGLAADTDALFHEAFAALRSTGPRLEGISGCPFLIFYGEVSDDSDGPVEPCRPIAGGGAVVAEGIETKVEAAHDEVYMRLGKD